MCFENIEKRKYCLNETDWTYCQWSWNLEAFKNKLEQLESKLMHVSLK